MSSDINVVVRSVLTYTILFFIYITAFTSVVVLMNLNGSQTDIFSWKFLKNELFEDISPVSNWRYVNKHSLSLVALREEACVFMGSSREDCSVPAMKVAWTSLLPWNALRIYNGINPKYALYDHVYDQNRNLHEERNMIVGTSDPELYSLFYKSIMISRGTKSEPRVPERNKNAKPVTASPKTLKLYRYSKPLRSIVDRKPKFEVQEINYEFKASK